MPDKINQDDLTESEIRNTYRVLETLRESLHDDDMHDEVGTVNEAHALVQSYDQGSNWRSQRPADRADPSGFKQLSTFEDPDQ